MQRRDPPARLGVLQGRIAATQNMAGYTRGTRAVPATIEHAQRAAHGRACPTGAPRVHSLERLTLPGCGQGSYPADGWRYDTSTDPAEASLPDRNVAPQSSKDMDAHPLC